MLSRTTGLAVAGIIAAALTTAACNSFTTPAAACRFLLRLAALLSGTPG